MRACPASTRPPARCWARCRASSLYHRPDDYVQTLKPRIEAQTDAEIQAAAKEIVQSECS